MKKEIEVKFEADDFRSAKKAIRKIGGRLVWKGKEKNLFFDAPGLALVKSGIFLRLREWRGAGKDLTLKKPSGRKNKKFKIMEEIVVEINDVDAARKILEALGFSECFRYSKNREHWQLKGASIELDELKDGRRFIEIEAPVKKIKELAETLSLDWKKSTTKGYLDILNEKRRLKL